MSFQTPQYKLTEYLDWTTSGHIQLPDFQRQYKWEDERIRSLLVTVLRGHPLGVVMLLDAGNNQVRFKPKPIAGANVPAGTEPGLLLLDGQQRLTSLTQALKEDGVVDTTDSRGKKIRRRYFIDMAVAVQGEDRVDDAVRSLPANGKLTSDFGKHVDFDVSTTELEHEHGYFPASLLFSDDALGWLFDLGDQPLAKEFNTRILQTALSYQIPAIQLGSDTSKSAVATVFEKVNTGGLALNVFELLTATFAGDRDYYDANGTDFRLNDDWQQTQQLFASQPVLEGLESTDFLQAVTLLATREANLAYPGPKPPAISARREDILKLTLDDYLRWREPLQGAFLWVANFLADRHIFSARFLPYPKQLVPLAVIRVIMGKDAELWRPSQRIAQWFWCGILGEVYGGTIETRFVWDIVDVPPWARGEPDASLPRTVQGMSFRESRLLSLRSRLAAAYKGIYSLLLDRGARDWMTDKALDKVQYVDLKVDIHHIFPKRWCEQNHIDEERRDCIVNKTPLSASTNQSIGGATPSKYLAVVAKKAGVSDELLASLLEGHLVSYELLAADNFDGFFADRREQLCKLIEKATGRDVQRDLADGAGDGAEPDANGANDLSVQFEPSALDEPEGVL
jgi:hypothetical protein